ncbi:MAG TPA: bifunctional phosphoribosylaminoimidazolecarboxamide formyltransferase/IMP cyclohydrolase [candidate division Zixibacteria bacterium]|nr:bifunctional phosphoribosylaminoimidazolecarboxamide formyltransferase/IMP cyclohydrolase [candidate division Zixibacteria bacterium]
MSLKVKRALISVWDKSGLEDFARTLSSLGVEIYTTGGTGKALESAGIDFVPLESLTGFSQLIGGRVKTLHPKIFAGILARRELDEHMQSIDDEGIPAFDLIAVNLYPFEETLAKTADMDERVEMIDIGGVSLLRAAGKNYKSVAVLCDPEDYSPIISELVESGEICLTTLKNLASKAFNRTAYYDSVIAETFTENDELPRFSAKPMKLVDELRYGENPHQSAALYTDPLADGGITFAQQLWGKQLSYNNILDLDAVYTVLLEFADEIASVIVKHVSPCGVALGDNPLEAYLGALDCDPVSAFGGIAGFTREVDLPTAEKMHEHFFECILAPDFSPEALEVLQKKKNLRLLKLDIRRPNVPPTFLRGVYGGLLAQSADPPGIKPPKWDIVTDRPPTPLEDAALRFAWRAVKGVKSNSVLIAGEKAVYGIGGGLPSRVDAAKLAVTKAGERAVGAVAASDAFFPFPDGMEVLTDAGVTAIVQPGGSLRDGEVTARANELGIAMIHTGMRHFRH